MSESGELPELLARAAAGDQTAVTELFSLYRKRLKQMIRLRLNRRLQSRVDESDILQDAFLEAARRLPDYLTNRPLPFFLWLRHITGEKLIDSHRRHLGRRCATPPRKCRSTGDRCRERARARWRRGCWAG